MNGQNSNKKVISNNQDVTINYQDTFYIIPRYIRQLEGMTLTFLDFFETIFQFWNKGKSCFLSNSVIKERTGIESDSRINKAFQFFEKHNVMKRVYKNNKRYIVPALNHVEIENNTSDEEVIHINSTNFEPEGHSCPPGVSLQREGGISTERGGVSLERDINKEIIKKEINKVCSHTPRTTKFSIYDHNPFGFTEETLKGYSDMRKAIKKPLTEQAWKLILKEMQKAVDMGYTAQDCIDEAIINSWQGFKADWIHNRNTHKTQNKAPTSDFYHGGISDKQVQEKKRLEASKDALAFRELKRVVHTETSKNSILQMKDVLKNIYEK
jgi:hypothetical protein